MNKWDLGIPHGICDTSKMESSIYHGLPKNDLVEWGKQHHDRLSNFTGIPFFDTPTCVLWILRL